MIKILRWTCKQCDAKYYFRSDTEDERNQIRLVKLQKLISQHIMDTKHEVLCREGDEFKFKLIRK